ncbi:MAG: glutamate formimidoyltransferase [Prevotella sp.]|nr:glutamate formimidoyltransferase [Prevotella sp.]
MEEQKQLIECVPNFSEGCRPEVIRQIADAIEGVVNVRLLHIDSGEAANRTVFTFAGEPTAVCEAAFRAVKVAGELIDMRLQTGTHPRIGATDVLPLVPICGITLEECALLARQLAERIARELLIPCYAYEAAAHRPEHRNLADCRRGEYEGLPQRMEHPIEQPDYGARPYDEGIARTGCTVVGARNYLVAVNFNLDTKDVSIAKTIAARIREKGGGLPCVKAIGWYIEEYGIAQVSCNLTDFHVTPLPQLYAAVCREAERVGVGVTGTEIIGLVPQAALGNVEEAIQQMHLDDLCPFVPEKKVIERLL